MRRIRDVLQWTVENPAFAILAVLSFALLIFGVYLGSPYYVSGPQAAASQLFHDQIDQLVLAAVYVTPPLMTLYGVFAKKRKWIVKGAKWLFVVYLFATLLRITAIGFTPLLWVFLLACGLTAGICSLSLEFKQK